MVNAATVNPPANAPGGKNNAPALLVPFVRAAEEHREPFNDVSFALSAVATSLAGPYDIPAYGFLRGVFLQVDATGGNSAGVAVFQEDGPWSAIQEVQLFDVNGAPIFGPVSGYDLYLINKYGAYADAADPRTSPYFAIQLTTGAGCGNFSFILRVPVEVSLRDGLGALGNQNASSTFKIRTTIAASTAIYSTAPTTLPTMRIRHLLDAWTQPPATDLQGNANATMPPAHGTTQYWSKTIFNLAAGQQTVRLPRVGNYIRDLIFIARDNANGTRTTGGSDMPDPTSIFWDTRLLNAYPRGLWRHQMQQKYGYIATSPETAAIQNNPNALDNGVFVEDYLHEFSGHAGAELRDGWLPTVQSTRLELQGSFAAATVLTVLTCDVSPAGQIFT